MPSLAHLWDTGSIACPVGKKTWFEKQMLTRGLNKDVHTQFERRCAYSCSGQSLPVAWATRRVRRSTALAGMSCSTADLRTKTLDFRDFDSSIILIIRGEIPRLIGSSPESLSQAILVGIILVGRWGVCHVVLREGIAGKRRDSRGAMKRATDWDLRLRCPHNPIWWKKWWTISWLSSFVHQTEDMMNILMNNQIWVTESSGEAPCRELRGFASREKQPQSGALGSAALGTANQQPAS